MPSVTWGLKSDVFPESHASIRNAILRAGHTIVEWSDTWLTEGPPARLSTGPTVFHGSLGNAAHVSERFDWTPGSFCDSERFRCSYWYDYKQKWLIHERYAFTTVAKLVENARVIAESVGATDAIFVRPDSPLKPYPNAVIDVVSRLALGCTNR